MPIHQSVLELVGDTPIVQAQHLDAGLCTIYLKLESQNPGGSIKDRIGLSMIEAAEKRGDIKSGDTLVEALPATPASAWRWSRSRRVTS
jgi:cystathionine beta-synthase